MTLPIAIVGAGIGGLTAALALLRAGRSVTVLEQAPQLGEIGAGITLSPNATRVLDALGLEEAIAEAGHVPQVQAIRHHATGETLVEVPRRENSRDRYGAHYYQIHRADVHEALVSAVQALDAAAIRTGMRVVQVEQGDGEVAAILDHGERIMAQALIGADGVKSAVRAHVAGPGEARFTGYVAWRGLVPVTALPPGLLKYPSQLAIGPGRVFGQYLVRGGALLNYAAIARSDSWTDDGWTTPSSLDEVLAAFADYHEDTQAIIRATPPGQCFKWGLFDYAPLPAWVKGRVALLGDAAHAMLPFMGQGAAMAIEDAAILARAIAAHPLDEALPRYEAARKARASFVQEESRLKGERMLADDTASYGRGGAGHRNEESLGLFDYDALRVAI